MHFSNSTSTTGNFKLFTDVLLIIKNEVSLGSMNLLLSNASGHADASFYSFYKVYISY
jgi:hypothetical protein